MGRIDEYVQPVYAKNPKDGDLYITPDGLHKIYIAEVDAWAWDLSHEYTKEVWDYPSKEKVPEPSDEEVREVIASMTDSDLENYGLGKLDDL